MPAPFTQSFYHVNIDTAKLAETHAYFEKV